MKHAVAVLDIEMADVLACLPKLPLGATGPDLLDDVFGGRTKRNATLLKEAIKRLKGADVGVTTVNKKDAPWGYRRRWGIRCDHWERVKELLKDWAPPEDEQ